MVTYEVLILAEDATAEMISCLKFANRVAFEVSVL
jgi:hypothetical protein